MLLCYPVTTSEPDRAGIYHAGLAGAARRQFLGEFHREEPMERRRGGGEQAPVDRERAATSYQGDVRVNRPRPQALHVFLIGTRGQTDLRRHRFGRAERRLSSKIVAARVNVREEASIEQKKTPILLSTTL